jgi:hypothetical protein
VAELEQGRDKSVYGQEGRDELIKEIVRFLYSIPGNTPYTLAVISEVVACVFESVSSGQYILHRNDKDEINIYVGYWLIDKGDIADIEKGIKPAVRCFGDCLYIVDFGSKPESIGPRNILNQLKGLANSVVWHRWGKKGVRTWHGC